MTTIAKENLDERIERIKKRNEEIEKKYREAEEDRLMALKDNAMVEIKPPKDEDWPKAHKYDKIDFTYDVKPEKLEELNKQKHDEINIKNNKRDHYKKFADGEGPPPDPAYNFLADAERDGITVSHKSDVNKKDSRQNNNNTGSNKNNKDYNQQQQQNKRGTTNNSSFRGRGNNNGKNHNFKNQKSNSQPEYEQWRHEREKIDEARINRQKIGDGKWKREWDNDKMNADNEALSRLDKVTIGSSDAFSNTAAIVNLKKSPTHNGYNYYNGGGLKMKRQNSGSNFKTTTDCLVEKRGNITVSVSQTGEVKSVKLTSTPAIGTGRVGPRQISKPQFQIQTVEREVTIQPTPLSPRAQNKNSSIRSNTTNNNAMVVSNQMNLSQKVPNKSNIIIDTTLNMPSKTNSERIKKNKKHSPKESSGGHQDNIMKQAIKSVVHPVAGYQPISQQIQNVSPNLVSNVATNKLPTASLFDDITSSSQSSSTIQSSLSGNEIPIPMVDLSHKPEFQKRSIQDRLLRVRQTNNTVTNNCNNDTTVNDSGNVSTVSVTSECKNELLEIINENSNERSIDKKSIENNNEIKNDNANLSSIVTANDAISEEKIALENQKIESCDNLLLSETVSSPSTSQLSVETATTAAIVCK